MTLAAEETRPAFPLGRPEDGRPRFGMTPEQATVYAHIVDKFPHDESFLVVFRKMSADVGMTLAVVHNIAAELFVRGWIEPDYTGPVTMYRFVKPIMRFRAPAPESLKKSLAGKRRSA